MTVPLITTLPVTVIEVVVALGKVSVAPLVTVNVPATVRALCATVVAPVV